MTSFRASLIALAALAASAIPVFAADLGDYRDDETPSMSAARFYIRGDLGYDWNKAPSMSTQGVDFNSVSMHNDWSYGGGLGWYLAPNWRVDVTAEHHSGGKVEGTIGATANFTGGTQSFTMTSDVILANVYYDFTGRAGFNPYLGAGIGWAANHTTSGTATDTCGCTSNIDSATSSNFAWALMAGFTHELDHGFSVDVGYRFLDVGEAHTGNVFKTSGTAYDSSSLSTGKVYSNEIRVGLRYDIN